MQSIATCATTHLFLQRPRAPRRLRGPSKLCDWPCSCVGVAAPSRGVLRPWSAEEQVMRSADAVQDIPELLVHERDRGPVTSLALG